MLNPIPKAYRRASYSVQVVLYLGTLVPISFKGSIFSGRGMKKNL